jgi:hypothetical protein
MVNAGRSVFFPEIGNGVKPYDPPSAAGIFKKDPYKFQEYSRIGKIVISLIRAERGPYIARRSAGRGKGAQQGMGTGPYYLGIVIVLVPAYIPGSVNRVVIQKALKPRALNEIGRASCRERV